MWLHNDVVTALDMIFFSLIAGPDYTAVNAFLNFTNESRICTQVFITDNDLVEPDEEFNLTISITPPVPGVIIGNGGMATVTILDTDGKHSNSLSSKKHSYLDISLKTDRTTSKIVVRYISDSLCFFLQW